MIAGRSALSRALGASLWLGALGWAGPALAETPDAVSAQALFERGRELLLKGKIAEACPQLEESLRLDSATGTLMAVAMCHEQAGKFASAWAEFSDAEGRAKRDHREDRQKLARERATALKPRLSSIQLNLPSDVAALPGLEVRRDGALVGEGVYNVAIPIDGGKHTVAVTAPGKRPYKTTVSVKLEGDAVIVPVPPLEDAPSEAVAPPPAAKEEPPSEPPPAAASDSKPWGALEWTGVGAAAVGVGALGVGTYFLATALGEKSDSEADCTPYCNPKGLETRSSMVKHGNLATVFGIGGGVLLGAGATLFIVGRTSGGSSEHALRLSPTLAVRDGGAMLGVDGALW